MHGDEYGRRRGRWGHGDDLELAYGRGPAYGREMRHWPRPAPYGRRARHPACGEAYERDPGPPRRSWRHGREYPAAPHPRPGRYERRYPWWGKREGRLPLRGWGAPGGRRYRERWWGAIGPERREDYAWAYHARDPDRYGWTGEVARH